MSRGDITIEIGGATYCVSRELPLDGHPKHLLTNIRSNCGVLIAEFHELNGDLRSERTDSKILRGKGDMVEIYPNNVVPYASPDEPWVSAMRRADGLLDDDPGAALPLLQQIVEQHPDNCVALHAMAVAYARLREFDRALGVEHRAVDIEPNNEIYRRGYVHMASRYGFFHHALKEYLVQFPRSTACDKLAFNTFLQLGEIDNARNLLDLRARRSPQPAGGGLAAKLRGLVRKPAAPDTQRARLDEAAERKIKFDELMARAREEVTSGGAPRKYLELARELFPGHPEAMANHALCMARDGEYQAAAMLLFEAQRQLPEPGASLCAMNSVFCLIRLGHYDSLSLIEAAIATRFGGTDPQEGVDLPGIAAWLEGGVTIEQPPSTALELLDLAIEEQRAAGAEIEPAVLHVRELYARATGSLG